ncbi:hypothetical protein LMBIIBHN_03889 [Aeromonas salmonicida]
MTEQAEGELDKVVAGTCPLQQGTKQYEQEHEAGRHAESYAKHPFRGDPLVVGQGSEAHAAVSQQTRHPGASQAVYEEQQGGAQGPSCRFQQQRNADAGRDQVRGGEAARTQGQRFIHHEQIRSRSGSNQPQRHVAERHSIPG